MINIEKKFRDRKGSLSKEIYDSGYLVSSGSVYIPSEAIPKNELEEILNGKGLIFPESLIDFYSQAGMLSLT